MPEDAVSRVPSGKWLLAIDTSSDQAGVALFDGDDLYLRQWPCVRAQTTEILPNIQAMLTTVRVTLFDLLCVAVATGPGAFTGLRVGMSLAKGFALGRSLPIVGVPTLQAAAYLWTRVGLPVIAAVPAGRGRLVWQRFPNPDSEVKPENTTSAELIEAVRAAPVKAVVGEFSAQLRNELRDLPVPIISGPESPPRVGAIAVLGFARYLGGEIDDAATLEPTYVHGVRAATRSVADPRP